MDNNQNKEIIVKSDLAGVENFEQALEMEVKDAEVINPEDVTVIPEVRDEEALANMPVNIPYRKIFNDEGEWVNKITKGNPYLMPFMNRQQRKALIRKATRNPKNNKRGIRLIVTPFAKGKFLKTYITKQRIERGVEKPSLGANGNMVVGTKVHAARTIIHNKMQLKNE